MAAGAPRAWRVCAGSVGPAPGTRHFCHSPNKSAICIVAAQRVVIVIVIVCGAQPRDGLVPSAPLAPPKVALPAGGGCEVSSVPCSCAAGVQRVGHAGLPAHGGAPIPPRGRDGRLYTRVVTGWGFGGRPGGRPALWTCGTAGPAGHGAHPNGKGSGRNKLVRGPSRGLRGGACAEGRRADEERREGRSPRQASMRHEAAGGSR